MNDKIKKILTIAAVALAVVVLVFKFEPLRKFVTGS
jgi:hypothetical protein